MSAPILATSASPIGPTRSQQARPTRPAESRQSPDPGLEGAQAECRVCLVGRFARGVDSDISGARCPRWSTADADWGAVGSNRKLLHTPPGNPAGPLALDARGLVAADRQSP